MSGEVVAEGHGEPARPTSGRRRAGERRRAARERAGALEGPAAAPASTSPPPSDEASQEAPWEAPDAVALLAGRYRLGRAIGSGGQASVHRALHAELDLPVAIKLIHLDGTSPSDAERLVLRFLREARTAARIRHRNVLAVQDTGRTPDGSPFLVMELIEGEDLEQRIASGPIGIPGVVDLGRQLFAALTAISDANVLHRDVKPANIMLHRETDGQVLLKLVDFGIARIRDEQERLTVTGAVVGTPHYMSPEQLRGEELDARADLYAACAVLFEATTGRPPFDGSSAAHVVGSILSAPLPSVQALRPDCPESLAWLIESGLARRREDRPAHPLQMVAALERVAREEGLPTGSLAWAQGVQSADPMMGQVPEPQLEAPPRRVRARLLRLAFLVVRAISLLLIVSGAAAVLRAPSTALRPVSAQVAPQLVLPSGEPAPDVDALLERGLRALAQGEVDAALVHYRSAAAAAPDRPEPHRGLGLAAARAGLDDEAILAFERYLDLAPDAPDADRVRERLEQQRARRSDRLAASGP